MTVRGSDSLLLPIVGTLCGLLALYAITAVPLIPRILDSASVLRPWRVWDVVVAPGGTPYDAVQEAVGGALGTDPALMGAATARVAIENFAGGELVPVAAIDDRFDASDPRLDPFLVAVDRLFHIAAPEETQSGSGPDVAPDSGWDLYYLPAVDAPETIARRLAESAVGVRLAVAARRIEASLVAGGLAVLAVAWALFTAKRRRGLMAFVVIPVALHAAAAGPVGVVGAGALGFAWVRWTDARLRPAREAMLYGRTRGTDQTETQARQLLALVVVVSVVASLAAGTQIQTALLIASLAATNGAIRAVESMRLRRCEHTLLEPRPILPLGFGRRRTDGMRGWGPAVVALAVVALTLALVDRSVSSVGALAVPTPVHVPDLQGDPLATARTVDPSTVPLSTSGMVAHRAYQEGLSFGARWSVPVRGTSVTISRARRADGTLQLFDEAVITYSDEWVDRTLLPGADASLVYEIFRREGGVLVIENHPVPTSGWPQIQLIAALAASVAMLAAAGAVRLPYRDVIGTVGLATRSQREPS